MLRFSLLASVAAAWDLHDFPAMVDGKYPGGDEFGLFVRSSDDVPTVGDQETGELFYLEANINLGEVSLEAASQYHSGIGIQFGDSAIAAQWYAKDGLATAVFPGTDGEWHNDAVLALTPYIDTGYWKMQNRIGHVSGAQWNNLRSALAKYAQDNRFYQLFRVTSADGSVYVEDAICDDFSVFALKELSKLGADMEQSTILRNYIDIITDIQPTAVQLPTRSLAEYLQALQSAIQNGQTSVEELVHSLVQTAKERGSTAFMGSPATGLYEVTPVLDVRVAYEEVDIVSGFRAQKHVDNDRALPVVV